MPVSYLFTQLTFAYSIPLYSELTLYISKYSEYCYFQSLEKYIEIIPYNRVLTREERLRIYEISRLYYKVFQNLKQFTNTLSIEAILVKPLNPFSNNFLLYMKALQ